MKVFEGIVTSIKMKDTAVVEVTSKTPHKLYRKLMKRSKKFKASVEGHDLSVGQKVLIAETKPISKDKHFKIIEVRK